METQDKKGLYEGHTPGPWGVVAVKGGWTGVAPIRCGRPDTPDICCLSENNEFNAILIADAPKLLAENRLLREALEGMLIWARRVKGVYPGNEIVRAINALAGTDGRTERE